MMMPPQTEIADAWRTLEAGGGSNEFAVATVQLGLDAGYGPVRIAKGVDGEDRLLIPTESGRRIPDTISGDAVDVKIVQLIVAGRARPFIQMICGNIDLQAPFRGLADDVLRRLAAGNGPEKAVCDAVLQFRDLLRQRPVYSLENLIGIFGELQLLSELIRINPSAAVCWTGPLRQRHDFSSAELSVEVKATLQRHSRQVQISSLEQLQAPASGQLFLYFIVLERSGGGGRSVREVLEHVERVATDPTVIDRALQSMNMADWRTNEKLATERFSVLRVEVFRVDSEFPRLDPSSFLPDYPPAGVVNVEYTLDLGHAKAWRVEPTEIPLLLKQLAGVL